MYWCMCVNYLPRSGLGEGNLPNSVGKIRVRWGLFLPWNKNLPSECAQSELLATHVSCVYESVHDGVRSGMFAIWEGEWRN